MFYSTSPKTRDLLKVCFQVNNNQSRRLYLDGYAGAIHSTSRHIYPSKSSAHWNFGRSDGV